MTDYESRRTSFGAFADDYDRYRPNWPDHAVDYLTGCDTRRRSLDVIDVGAGTGKLTTRLLAHGHRVTAVEPSDGMLDVLRRRAPAAEALTGSAEALPVDDASADVVVAVQAWHWFDAAAAAAEAARALRPGGLLSLGWHVADENAPLIADLAAALSTTDGFGQHSDDIPGALAGFGAQEQRELRYDATMPAHELAAMAATWSYVALASDRAAILDRIAVVAATHADAAGSVTVPYRTFCYRYRRA